MKKATFLIITAFTLAALPVLAEAAPSQVQIVKPADGATFYPGQNVTVIVEGSSDIETAMVTVEKPLAVAHEVGPLQYALTIPPNIPEGTYHIRAMAQSAGKFVESAPLSLNVAWPKKLVSAEPYPSPIALDGVAENLQLKVLGTFENGVQADIAQSQKSIYVSSDPDIVTVSLDGVVTSLGYGQANIVFKNSGVTSTIPVTVTNAGKGRITYDLEIAANSPLSMDEKQKHYIAHMHVANDGTVPLAYIKILSVTLNDKPVRSFPAEKLNFKMGDEWTFDLSFPTAAGARETTAKLRMTGVYSAVPEFYHNKEIPFDTSVSVDLP